MLLGREPPTESEKEPRAATSLSAPLGEKAIGVGLCGSAGGESGELDEIAAVERKLRDFLGGDDLAERRIGGFDGDGGGVDFHSWRRTVEGESVKFEFAGFIDLQAEVLAFGGLKTLEIRRAECKWRREAEG